MPVLSPKPPCPPPDNDQKIMILLTTAKYFGTDCSNSFNPQAN